MRAFVLIAVATLIFLSKGAPAPTAPKSADGVLKSALSALEKAMKDVKLTPQQIQNLEKPNLEREEMLLQHGVVFCRTVKKECAAHPEADCTLQLKQCFDGVKVCAAAESLCLDILSDTGNSMCAVQRNQCFEQIKNRIR
ncbi:hypothetical protein QR680_012334 [Steinernema hermaphroditum]|uniref:Uncharacterized protein n=1 Tax=Steinernema hermaphroditum TaxID=289476 RepID=A0AA39I3P1_9BILA|nr:hypothetical protein QR680_012334 [Steinernema hermaphroditum]